MIRFLRFALMHNNHNLSQPKTCAITSVRKAMYPHEQFTNPPVATAESAMDVVAPSEKHFGTNQKCLSLLEENLCQWEDPVISSVEDWLHQTLQWEDPYALFSIICRHVQGHVPSVQF